MELPACPSQPPAGWLLAGSGHHEAQPPTTPQHSTLDAWPFLTPPCPQLAKRLFGVDIEAADGLAPTWHEDVRLFRVLKDGAPKVRRMEEWRRRGLPRRTGSALSATRPAAWMWQFGDLKPDPGPAHHPFVSSSLPFFPLPPNSVGHLDPGTAYWPVPTPPKSFHSFLRPSPCRPTSIWTPTAGRQRSAAARGWTRSAASRPCASRPARRCACPLRTWCATRRRPWATSPAS